MSGDFSRIASEVLSRFDLLIAYLGIEGGKRQGQEYLACNPKRNDAKPGSFSINTRSGAWADFATGDRGGDLISLTAYLRGETQIDAARALAHHFGIPEPAANGDAGGAAKGNGSSRRQQVSPEQESGSCLMPVPDDAPSPPEAHPRHGKPSICYEYRTQDGKLCFYHWRFDAKREGERKQFCPVTLWRLPDGKLQWRFKAPTGNRPLYGLPSLAGSSQAVILTEGEKACDAAARLLPGHPVLCWQGGCQAVSKADFSPLAGREVWLWPDADAPGQKAMIEAKKRLQAISAGPVRCFDLAAFARTPGNACLLPGDQLQAGDDAADLVARGWTAEHFQILLAEGNAFADEPALEQQAITPELPAGRASSSAPAARRFESDDKGIWFVNEDDRRQWICSPLEITARVRTPGGSGWGKLLEFSDPDRNPKQRILPDALLSGDGTELERLLRDDGLHIAPQGKARLRQYLIETAPKARVRIVGKPGWHDAGKGGPVFVTGEGAIGGSCEVWMLNAEAGITAPYEQHGTLRGWQEEIAARCVGNSRLVFAVSSAFASPLLYLVGMESGGFHFVGNSADGKTTALRVAASVCGGPGYLKRWRATDNALETTALQHNDALLVLDEISQIDPRSAGETSYMISNGSGKQRASKTGGARETVHWRTLFLSSGETSLAAHVAEAGKSLKAGQSLRMAEIPTDAGAGLGIFENLHGHTGGAAMADALTAACTRHYGGAFLRFLEELIQARESVVKVAEEGIRFFTGRTLTEEAHGQARRVAARFALVGAAGELATRFGVTGWPEGEAMQAARRCFMDWVKLRGGMGDYESSNMLSRVRRFFEQHGEARFTDWNRPATLDDHAARVMHRCGFRRFEEGEGSHWYVFPESFISETCAGVNAQSVAHLLHQRGYLEPGSEKDRPFTVRVTLPGEGRRRVYHILPAIMDSGTDADD